MKLLKIIRYIFYFVIQSTWGIFQNLSGFILFLKNIRCRHAFYHGSIVTYHDGDWGGVSLGAFIFVNHKRGEDWTKPATVHEFGHTVQSLILGPLYLFVIGLPSFIWCNNKKCIQYRKDSGKTYYDLFCEKGANTLGARVTGEAAPVK